MKYRMKILTLSAILSLSSLVIADNKVGCPGVEYPDWKTSEYVLPFEVGKTVKVQLGNCSSSYHSEQYPDKFAYDFVMDIGTEIYASRAGKVVYVEEFGLDYRHPNNLVIVDHGDNTFAEYMHLTKNGAAVEVDDEVKAGDLIGYSGATGLAGYPHLHFIVVKDDPAWPYVAIPITFRNTEANPRGLKSYTKYTALPFE